MQLKIISWSLIFIGFGISLFGLCGFSIDMAKDLALGIVSVGLGLMSIGLALLTQLYRRTQGWDKQNYLQFLSCYLEKSRKNGNPEDLWEKINALISEKQNRKRKKQYRIPEKAK